MKRFMVAMAFALGLGFGTLSYADTVAIDGQALDTDARPYNVEGRILVPVRALLEALNFELQWNESTRQIRALNGSYEISMQIDNREASVNGNSVKMDVPAQLIDNRTYIPVRFVSEASGADVNYNAESRLVVVSTAKLKKALVFRDPQLKNTLESVLNKKELTAGDAFYVTDLDLSRSGIITLEGLEAFSNLVSLNLSGNRITDVTPLSRLSGLKALDISQNQVQDASPLKKIRSLSTLDIRDNKLASGLQLVQIASLKNLKLAGNPIFDYSSLYYAAGSLEALDIDRSKIEMPKFNTRYSIMGASFSIPLSGGVEWVPLSSTGGSRIENSQVKTILKQGFTSLQGQVRRPYELIQVLAGNTWFDLEDIQSVQTDAAGVRWTVLPSATQTQGINKGNANGIAVLAQGLLRGDYPESGYLAVVYDDNSYRLINYFMTEVNEKIYDDEDEVDRIVGRNDYYIFSPESYLPEAKDKPAVETGVLDDYFGSDVLSNMYKGKSLKVMAEWISKSDSDVRCIVRYTPNAADEKDPFAMGCSESIIYFPENVKASYELLYSTTPVSVAARKFSINGEIFNRYPAFTQYMYQ